MTTAPVMKELTGWLLANVYALVNEVVFRSNGLMIKCLIIACLM